MSDPALETLTAALAALPERADSLAPLVTALAGQEALTLAVVREHHDLLAGCADRLAAEETHIQELCDACRRLFPIPLPGLYPGF